jgi:hypothetical protein
MARMDDDAQLLHEQCGTSTLAQEARQSHVWDMTVKQNLTAAALLDTWIFSKLIQDSKMKSTHK